MSDSELDQLRIEESTERIGARWLAEIRAACVEVSRRFDPAVYAFTERRWTTGEIDDLLQDVTVEQLLRQGQLDYILHVAESVSDVHRLLRHQVRRALVRRRRLTVVDRLLKRIEMLVESSDLYETSADAPATRFRPTHSGFGPSAPSEDALHLASAAIRLLPTSPATGDRAPAVFRSEVLEQVVRLCFEACETSLSLDDFGKILRQALTSWIPVVLELNEELDVEFPQTADLLNDLEQTVNLMIAELNDTHRAALLAKLSGVSDTTLGQQLAVSRPTAAKIKSEAFDAARDAWERLAGDLTPEHDTELAQLLYLRLSQGGGQ